MASTDLINKVIMSWINVGSLCDLQCFSQHTDQYTDLLSTRQFISPNTRLAPN